MKTIYVHIGLHKTGTTTIQDYLIDNVEYLKTKGVLVPFAHRNHNLTFWVNGKENSQKRQNQWSRLMRKIDNSDAPITVLSSEFFSRDISEIDHWHLNFTDLVNKGHTVKFILYLRRSDKRFESLFIEAAKGGNGMIDIRDFPYERFIDNWNLCEAIKSHFGQDSLILRKFEEDAKQGLIGSFMSCLGVSMAEIDELKYQTNTKPNLDQLRAIIYAGELFGKITSPMFNSARQRRKAIKRWGRWFMDQTNNWEDQKSYTLLPNDIAKDILDDQFQSNKKIAETYFNGDMTHLHVDDLPYNSGENLSIMCMKKEALEHALALFTQVDKIVDSMNIGTPTEKRDLQTDVQDT
jgi:hypothetical protein